MDVISQLGPLALCARFSLWFSLAFKCLWINVCPEFLAFL